MSYERTNTRECNTGATHEDLKTEMKALWQGGRRTRRRRLMRLDLIEGTENMALEWLITDQPDQDDAKNGIQTIMQAKVSLACLPIRLASMVLYVLCVCTRN